MGRGRSSYVAQMDTMLEFAICAVVKPRSAFIECDSCSWLPTCQLSFAIFEGGGRGSERRWSRLGTLPLTSGGYAYHAQKAIMKPNHEKKNTRP